MKILTPSYVWLVASALFLTVGCAANVKCKDDCVQKITANNQVKIGWAKRSIDPGRVVPITGQLHLRISHGTHTPVLASALAMENNGDAVIFVSVDMVSVRPLIINTLRDILKAEAPEIPAEKVIVSATHTHSGPSHTDVSQESFPNQFKFMSGNDVRKFIVRQIADAVKEAWAKRAPGSIAYGYGLAVTGHSRRVAYLDDIGKRLAKTPGAAINGHVKKYGRTDDDMFAGYEAGFDAFINIVYTFDEKGKLNGAVVNVPCPAQTSENAWTLYASFWHNVREKLEAQYGEIGLICQSAGAGDLAPRQQHYKKAELRRYRLKYPKEMAEIEKLRSSNPEQSREKMRELMRKAAPEMGMRRGFRGGHGAGERPVTDLEPTPEQLESLKNKYPAEFAEYEKLKNSDKPEEKTLAAGKLKAIIKKAMAENPALLQGKFLRDRNRRAVNLTRRELKRRYPEKMREIEEIEKVTAESCMQVFRETDPGIPSCAKLVSK